MEAPLNQGIGYGSIIGMGIGFSLMMVCITFLQKRYTNTSPNESEEFNTASRSIKLATLAVSTVSSWCWSATLLTSSQSQREAFTYGISGAFFYAIGACIQILFFGALSAQLKLKFPFAHTFVECVRARWGTAGHHLALFLAMVTNVIVSSMLILGAATAFNTLTGMHIVACNFIIPVTVAIYVFFGGLRASLICDYIHTAVLYCVVIAFCLYAYTTSSNIGSLSTLYDLLVEKANQNPVDGNAQGSYLTIRATSGLIFLFINLCGNTATVLTDNAYYNRAFASDIRVSGKAFLVGALCWFPIPFCFASVMGLSGAALKGTNVFPELSTYQIQRGIPAIISAQAIMGNSGSKLILILLFLAVTSATSAELNAVSSILTYDVYKKYRPNASEKSTMVVSHSTVALFGLCQGALGCIFYSMGISMGYIYYLMGVIIGCGVAPVVSCIIWKKANKLICISGAVLSLCLGIVAWIVTAYKLYGKLDVDSTGADLPMLAGNTVSFGLSSLITIIGSLLFPDNYDFEATKFVGKKSADQATTKYNAHEIQIYQNTMESDDIKDEKLTPQESIVVPEDGIMSKNDEVYVKKWQNIATGATITWFILIIIIVTFSLFGTSYIYPLKGFMAWIIIGLIWLFSASIYAIFMPLWEYRQVLFYILKGITFDIFTFGNYKMDTTIENEKV